MPLFHTDDSKRSRCPDGRFAKSLKDAIIAVVMTYRGQVKNGVVVIEGPIRLEDGTLVTVQPVEQPISLPKPGTPEAILSCDAHWHGPPEEVDRLLEEVRRDKWAEVQAQLKTGADTAF